MRLAHRLFIRDSGDGRRVRVGDELYVVSTGRPCRLLARLFVTRVSHDVFRSRIDLTVGGPRTAIFFAKASDAVEVLLAQARSISRHREVTLLDRDATQILTAACGIHDFSRSPSAVRWGAIVLLVKRTVSLARSRRDGRPDVEITESFLRQNYVTSQLPGPAPVYQNAARIALGLTSTAKPSAPRKRHPLSRQAVLRGINEDVATGGHTPSSSRHQEILELLRMRLEQIGLTPTYDGLVDCIVDLGDAVVYFEVKSSTPGSVVHQIRTGLGQVLHYEWMDTAGSARIICGHLVVDGPWGYDSTSLREFVESWSVRLTWSKDISSLTKGELHPR